MELSYYYGREADKYSFIRIPKMMVTEDVFASLSLQSKILYGLLLDRVGDATKNNWLDEEQKVYVIYPIAQIQEDMKISKKKAVDSLSELESVGLIEKKQRGLGQPNILYVKDFAGDTEVPKWELPEV